MLLAWLLVGPLGSNLSEMVANLQEVWAISIGPSDSHSEVSRNVDHPRLESISGWNWDPQDVADDGADGGMGLGERGRM